MILSFKIGLVVVVGGNHVHRTAVLVANTENVDKRSSGPPGSSSGHSYDHHEILFVVFQRSPSNGLSQTL